MRIGSITFSDFGRKITVNMAGNNKQVIRTKKNKYEEIRMKILYVLKG